MPTDTKDILPPEAHAEGTTEVTSKTEQHRQKLKQMLRDAAQHNKHADRMQQTADNIYAIFKKEIDVDTWMSVTEFNEYAPLFDAALRERILNGTNTIDEEMQIRELSGKLYHRINTRRPLHIYDPVSGKEIPGSPLPPIFANLNRIKTEDNTAVDNLSAMSQLDDGYDTGPSAISRLNAFRTVGQCFTKAQTVENFQKQEAEFVKLAAHFDNSGITTKLGHVTRPLKEHEKAAVQQAQQTTATVPAAAPDPATTEDDDIDFELD